MRGGSRYKKHPLTPDPVWNSTLVAQLTNHLMLDGKKVVAQKIVENALNQLSQMTKKPPVESLETAIKNVSPLLEVRSRRIGGANYQVPMEVRPERKVTLSFRWLLAAARGRKGMPMEARLAQELADAFQGQGAAMKKREDLHKMAEANRAFAHFARF